MTTEQQPIYDNKVNKVLQGLKEGKTRDQLAEEFRNKDYKALDVYMRRRHFTWNQDEQTYEPKVKVFNQENALNVTGTKTTRSIINAFQRGQNAKEVAKEVGFASHRDIGEYMTKQGFEWSFDLNNYIQQSGATAVAEPTKDIKEENKERNIEEPSDKPAGIEVGQEIEMTIPKREQPEEQGEDNPLQTLQVVYYKLPGKAGPKSFQLNHELADMFKEFCDNQGIHQKDVMEKLMLEFLKEQGYGNEIRRRFNA